MKAVLKCFSIAVVTMALLCSCSSAEPDRMVNGFPEQLVCVSADSIVPPSTSSAQTGQPDTLIAWQSSGSDMCKYVFTQSSRIDGIRRYNQRLNRWDDVELPSNVPEGRFHSAFPKGSAHIVLIGDEGPSMLTTPSLGLSPLSHIRYSRMAGHSCGERFLTGELSNTLPRARKSRL